MFVKLLILTVFLCVALKPREVNSTEFLRNALSNVKSKVKELAHQVHNIFEPNHKHPEQEITTKLPLIDIRYGPNINENQIGAEDGIVFPEDDGSISTTEHANDGNKQGSIITTSDKNKEINGEELSTTENLTPDLASRTIIGAPCANGMRSVDGTCRKVIG